MCGISVRLEFIIQSTFILEKLIYIHIHILKTLTRDADWAASRPTTGPNVGPRMKKKTLSAEEQTSAYHQANS